MSQGAPSTFQHTEKLLGCVKAPLPTCLRLIDAVMEQRDLSLGSLGGKKEGCQRRDGESEEEARKAQIFSPRAR